MQEGSAILLLIFFLLLFLATVFVAFWYFRSSQKKGEVTHALNMALLLITVPLHRKKDVQVKEEEQRLIGVMEQFYSSITQQKGSWVDAAFSGTSAVAFEIAVHTIGEEVHFYMSVPRKYMDTIEKQITALIGGSRVEIVNDYNIFNYQGVTRGAYLTLSRSFYLPLKTYKNLESDPLNTVVNAMSRLEFEGEGSAIQILIKPNKVWQKTAQKMIMEMRKGKSFSEAYMEATKGVLATVIEIFQKGKKQEKPELEKEQKALDETTIKALESKISKVGFDINIRLMASAYTETRANAILSDIENAFLQFENPAINSFKINNVKDKKLDRLIYNFSFRNFNNSEKSVLNSEELASIFHFPTPYMEVKKIKAQKAKTAPAPVNLPKEGLFIGTNAYRGVETPIRLAPQDRLRHLYIIGQTGTGKSVSLKNMIRQDIENGEGVCFIDPHGEDLEDILTRIPKERAQDVIVFDPSDLQRPIGINMLEYNTERPEQKSFIINEMITIFDKLYDLKSTGGPMFEHYLRNALLLIMLDPESGSTLVEVPRIFADKDFRHMKLSRISDPLVKNFWIKEAEKAGGESSLANMVPYITSKFNVFLANEFVRPIVAQQKSTINFREIMDGRKIFLVNLSKGKIGDINSNLLGLIIVSKLTMAALARGDMPQEQRHPFYLYIDEFQNFATDSVAVILSEARKYKLSLTVAHQFIAQLPENIKNAVFGNVGSIMSFRVGVDDAEFLEKQFAPEFDSNDLANLDNLNSYVKLLINNQASRPFNIFVNFPQKGDQGLAQKVKELSRLRYGKPRHEIDAEIEARFARREESPIPVSTPKPTL